MNKETIFTKIVSGEIPSYKLGENEHAYAFLDINPLMPGHALVVPKEAYPTIHETPDETLHDLISLVKEISTTIKKTLDADGINIQSSNGVEANQDIEHLHFHIVPRFSHENFDIWEGLKKGEGKVKGKKFQIESVEDIYQKIMS